MTNLKKIVKTSAMIFLATDDDNFILAEEDKFLIIKDEDKLSKILKSD